MRWDVTDAECGDDKPLVAVGDSVEQHAVVVERCRVERDPGRDESSSREPGDGSPPGHLGEKARSPLDDVAYRPKIGSGTPAIAIVPPRVNITTGPRRTDQP